MQVKPQEIIPIKYSKNTKTITKEINNLLSTYTNPILYERLNHVIKIITYLQQKNIHIELKETESKYHLYNNKEIIWQNIQDIENWTSNNFLILKKHWRNTLYITNIIQDINKRQNRNKPLTWKNADKDTHISQHSYIESIRYLQHHGAPSLPCI